ncbi:EMB1674 protein [Hibiscus syriacus]|uniref:EMB1674 protein n=1 Tax=Hibiscus syriacus TaxID=106335 RepID=A0A6A2Z0P5_HIBSY|nr:protein EMBRYO DEFECTIVE 1674-like [Hibiscus syriacus]KAE8685346.1 EMB1674 protein [Hibiscus syriacus]
MGKRKEKRKYSKKPYTSDQLVPVPIASPTPLVNLSLNSVLLYDWWLCTAKPRDLAVGGFECRGRQGQRVMYSAAIAKRHDATTLETTDGIMVAISGFINTSRTLENGFSPKVCGHFLFGFPYDWEEYASPSEACSSNEESVCHGSSAISSLPPSLDKLHVPAARMRDLLMFSAGDSQKLVFDHMLQKLSSHDSQNAVITVGSNTGNKHPEVRPYSAADCENSNCQKKVKVIENDNNTSCSRSKTRVESKEVQSRIGVGSITQTIGVKTRSLIRLKQKRDCLHSLDSQEKSIAGKIY